DPAAPAPVAAPAPDAPPDRAAAPVAPAADGPPGTTSQGGAGPEIDVVRIAPDGSGLLAGSAAPEAEIELLLDGAPIATARADARGQFAALLSIGPGDAPRVLSARSIGPAGSMEAPRFVIVEPREAALPDMAPAPVPTDDGPAASTAPTPTPADPPASAARPRLLMAGEEGLRVVQGSAPDAPGGLALDTIAYDETGGAVLGGRASAGSTVRIYLDNDPLDTVPADSGGHWRLDLPALPSQLYTLRVDQIGPEGGVTARTESPFRPEAPEDVRRVLARLDEAGENGAAAPARRLTVQPGFTLWGIAEASYGDGFQYVKVFDANADRIRDPDLIYPGQIFDLPE
ncbi:LysM peptidoglycan-binding domain-containing protein, partial [Palleronia sediminis]|uniref:LysM peptidoglycan-binding domain-containing protein n=1 Tax=Palleronia sediminis TaxID=2547833 RepID=UPI0014552635